MVHRREVCLTCFPRPPGRTASLAGSAHCVPYRWALICWQSGWVREDPLRGVRPAEGCLGASGETAATLALGASAFGRAGSNPALRTRDYCETYRQGMVLQYQNASNGVGTWRGRIAA